MNNPTAKPFPEAMRELFTEWDTRRNDESDPAPEILERLRNFFESSEDVSTEKERPAAEILDAAHKAWKENPNDPDVLRNLLDEKKPKLLQSASVWKGAKEPRPILWRDNSMDPDDRYPSCAVSAGEIGILSSAGGIGKSYLSLAWAQAACNAHAEKEDYGTACGMRVVAAPTGIISYEDTPERIAVRLERMGDEIPKDLHLWPNPDPLWYAEADKGGKSRSAPQWPDLWEQIRQLGIKLLIIDPASAALADVSTSETGPVRAFLRELALEAKRAGCGVLIVAHNTKAARIAIAQGDLETGAADPVAGSSVWYDGARGVLVLTRDRLSKTDRILVLAKSNYGRTGWGARLRERFLDENKQHFAGLELGAEMDADAVNAWSESVAASRRKTNPKEKEKSTSSRIADSGPEDPEDWEVGDEDEKQP